MALPTENPRSRRKPGPMVQPLLRRISGSRPSPGMQIFGRMFRWSRTRFGGATQVYGAGLAGRLPSAEFDDRGEDVAAAAHRLDQAGVLRVVFELAAQPSDLNIDRPVERTRLAVARQIEEPVARQHLIGIVDERGEQIELAGG